LNPRSSVLVVAHEMATATFDRIEDQVPPMIHATWLPSVAH
jgi:hypothetical protein